MISASASAQQPTAASLARTVDAHYNHLQSLQARYTERYQGMGMDRSESGTMTLRKAGKMRWAYDTPAGKLFVLDGKSGISYTPGDVQATRIPAKQLDDLHSPLRFLLGHTDAARTRLVHALRHPQRHGAAGAFARSHGGRHRPDPRHAPRRNRRLDHHLHLHRPAREHPH
jgi:hypothetical protein